MRERRRSECDREGLSSTFRRKMRPRSGMYGPVIHKCGRRIPYAGRSRFAGPSPCASGRDREGRSSIFRRKMRSRSGMHGPVSISAVVASPTRVNPASRVPLALRFGSRPRRAEQSLPKEDATPQRDARPQSIHNRGAASPSAAPSRFAAPRATLGAPFARSLTKQAARKAFVPYGLR